MDAKWFATQARKAAFTAASGDNEAGALALLTLANQIELEVKRLDDERRDNLMRTGSTSG